MAFLSTAIRETTGYDGGEVWHVDLAKFDTISAFANRFEKEGPGHLDFLINNSGMLTTKYSMTSDGYEKRQQLIFRSSHDITHSSLSVFKRMIWGLRSLLYSCFHT